jgi:flagellar hook-length control protein FliK
LAANELTKAAQNQAAISEQAQSKSVEAAAQINQKSETDVIPESDNASQTTTGTSHSVGKDKSDAAIGQLRTEATAASNQPTVIAESQQTNAVSDESAFASHQSASNASAKLELALNGGLSATESNAETKSANRSRSLEQSSAAESLTATDVVAATTTAQLANVALSTSQSGASNPTDATKTADSKDTSDQMSVSQTQASANQPASLSRNGSPNTQQPLASNAPAQLSNDGPKGGGAVLGGPQSPQNSIDRIRFVQRVARAFRAADEQGGQIRLRLSPPELGSLKVDVALRNGVMTARLEAETTSARTLLLDNLPALRQRLADQNIKIERFDVNLKQDGAGGGSANPSPDFSGSRGGSPMQQATARNRVLAKADAAVPPLAPAGRATDGRINIIV